MMSEYTKNCFTPMENSDIAITSLTTNPNTFCHLLKLGDTKILLNCGTPPDFSANDYKNVDFSDINVLLLSHMKISHIGALPLLKKLGFSGKIYATLPIKNIGRLVLLERNRHDEIFRESAKYAEREIESVFDGINGVKFLQPIEIGKNVVVVAHNAGCTLGGSVWRISRDTEFFVYAVGFDHRRTNSLNGIDLVALPRNATVVSDFGVKNELVIKRKERNAEILRIFENALATDTKVTVVVDHAHFLEIALLFDAFATAQKNVSAGCIAFFSKKFSELIKTTVEWTGENVAKEFLENKENPFIFRNIEFFANFGKMENKNVVFVFEEFGFFDSILEKSQNQKNLVLNFKDEKISVENFKDEKISILEIRRLAVFKTVEKKADDFEVSESSAESAEVEVVKNLEWHEEKTDVWNDAQNFYFPPVRTKRIFDEYNEFFVAENSEKVAKCEEEALPSVEAEAEVDEEISLVDVDLKIECEIVNFCLDTVSDKASLMNVLEFLRPKKLILAKRDEKMNEFYFARCVLSKSIGEVVEMERCVTISETKEFNRVILDEEFLNQNFKMVKNSRFLGFKGKVENGMVKYLGPLEKSIVVGDLNFNALKKSFVENNFEVEMGENSLIVEKDVKIMDWGNGEYGMEGEHCVLYYAVRSIVYKHITFL